MGLLSNVYDLVVYSLFAITHAHVASLVQENLPKEKVVDEIFHITQTQEFCAIVSESSGLTWTSMIGSMYNSYDGKITTPPGPYLLAQFYSQYILQDLTCSIESIRSVNIIFNLGTVIVLNEMLKLLEKKEDIGKRIHYTRLLILILLPVHFFFGFLFYTDAGSTFFILLSYLFALKIDFQNIFKSMVYLYLCSMIGFISLWFRQTNIIWYGFIVGTIILRFFKSNNNNNVKDDTRSSSNSSFSTDDVGSTKICIQFFNQLFQYIFNDCIQSKAKWFYGIISIIPIASVLYSFIAFLKWNNYQIVLGDQNHHQPVCHVPQLFYFIAFTMLPTFHLSLFLKKRIGPGDALMFSLNVNNFNWIIDRKYLLRNLISLLFVSISVYKFTMIHPFTLADNRHYMFYAWNKVLKYRLVQLSLIPIYFIIGGIFITRLLRQRGLLWLCGYVICTSLVLIPAHLIEFRYYTIPTFFATIHLLLDKKDESIENENQIWYMKWTVLCFVIGNALLLYVFLYRTFIYADGSIGRFMF